MAVEDAGGPGVTLLSGLSDRQRQWLLLGVAALVLVSLRVQFLAPALEDIDSVNFDLGVHHYDPVAHQPHPPGYPVYIVLAKASHAVFTTHGTALAILAALFSSLALFPLYFLMRELTTRTGAALACVFTLLSPLLWFNSVRPMSDLVGFFAATLVQCLLLKSAVDRTTLWYVSSALAGVAVGLRFQTGFLTVPLLLYGCVRDRRRHFSTLFAFCGGVCVWLIPLVYVMGGPTSAAINVAPIAQDTVTTDSLITHWTLRGAVFAGSDFLLAPWQHPLLGTCVLLSAAAGAVVLAFTDPRRLVLPLLLFLPYSAFHYVFQETKTLRYDIPAIPLVAFLASVPLTACRWRAVIAPAAALGFAAAAAAITLPALDQYHSTPSPGVQAVMSVSERATSERVVVSGHYAVDRYLPLLPEHLERLTPMPQHEWQSLTHYWKSGRRDPILFMRESKRTDLLQFGRDTQRTLGRWDWPAHVRPFMKGARPGSLELVRLEPPRWLTESGFFVTSEAGPYEEVKGQPHRLYVRPSPRRRVLMVSGSVEHGSGPVQLSLRNGDSLYGSWRAEGDFTLRTILPPITSDDYVLISLDATAPVALTDVWIERATRAVVRPARGFYIAERDDAARLYRWISREGHAATHLPTAAGWLTIEGWIPAKYYQLPVNVSLVWNGRPLASFPLSSERFRHQYFVERAPNTSWGELTIMSSHSFVPDERVRNGDRRVLSLRIYELSLETVDALSHGSDP